MSDYLDDAQIAKAKLAGVSGSFCLAKWKQTSLHLTTELEVIRRIEGW
jgi:hypothetical protein